MTLRATDRVALLATIDPDAYASGSSYSSDFVDVSKYKTLMAVVHVGDMVLNSDVDAKLEQDTDGQGNNTKDISGKAITTMEEGTDDNTQAIICVREDELDVAGGFGYVRLTITVATADADAAGAIYGLDPAHGLADDNDLASVAEIVD